MQVARNAIVRQGRWAARIAAALLGALVGIAAALIWVGVGLIMVRARVPLAALVLASGAWSVVPAAIVGASASRATIEEPDRVTQGLRLGVTGLAIGILLLLIVLLLFVALGINSSRQLVGLPLALWNLVMTVSLSGLFVPLLGLPAALWGLTYVGLLNGSLRTSHSFQRVVLVVAAFDGALLALCLSVSS